jgi:hypothetical protein
MGNLYHKRSLANPITFSSTSSTLIPSRVNTTYIIETLFLVSKVIYCFKFFVLQLFSKCIMADI